MTMSIASESESAVVYATVEEIMNGVENLSQSSEGGGSPPMPAKSLSGTTSNQVVASDEIIMPVVPALPLTPPSAAGALGGMPSPASFQTPGTSFKTATGMSPRSTARPSVQSPRAYSTPGTSFKPAANQDCAQARPASVASGARSASPRVPPLASATAPKVAAARTSSPNRMAHRRNPSPAARPSSRSISPGASGGLSSRIMSPRRSSSHLARVAPNLTGSYALEFEKVCRLARDENHDKHVENLEREIRDRIVQVEKEHRETKIHELASKEKDKLVAAAEREVEKWREQAAAAKNEMLTARSVMASAEKEKGSVEGELRRANLRATYQDKIYQGAADGQMPTGGYLAAQDEIMQLRKMIRDRDLALRLKDKAIKAMEADINSIQDKTESLFHRELQNQHAELERLNAELRGETRTLSRQIKIMQAAGDHENQGNQLEISNAEIGSLKEEVKFLKQQLEASEAAVAQQELAARVANKRLMMMSEILRAGSSRRQGRVGTPGVEEGAHSSPSLSPAHNQHFLVTGKVAEAASGAAFQDLSTFPHSASHLADAMPSGAESAWEQQTSRERVDGETVPSELFVTLQKEVLALRQDVRERDRALMDKDSVISECMRKTESIEKMRELELRKHTRETSELKKSLKNAQRESNPSLAFRVSGSPRTGGPPGEDRSKRMEPMFPHRTSGSPARSRYKA